MIRTKWGRLKDLQDPIIFYDQSFRRASHESFISRVYDEVRCYEIAIGASSISASPPPPPLYIELQIPLIGTE